MCAAPLGEHWRQRLGTRRRRRGTSARPAGQMRAGDPGYQVRGGGRSYLRRPRNPRASRAGVLCSLCTCLKPPRDRRLCPGGVGVKAAAPAKRAETIKNARAILPCPCDRPASRESRAYKNATRAKSKHWLPSPAAGPSEERDSAEPLLSIQFMVSSLGRFHLVAAAMSVLLASSAQNPAQVHTHRHRA